MRPVVVLVMLLSILTACVSHEELIARDNLTCSEIGFAVGTSEHRDCVLRLETARLQGHHHGY